MDKTNANWKDNLFDLDKVYYTPKHFLQCALYPAINICKTTNRKGKRLKTFDNRELFISTIGLSQFDLLVGVAYRKLISQYKKFTCLQTTITDFIHAIKRYDGGMTRQRILETLKREQKLYIGYEFSKGKYFEGHRVKKVKELRQHEFILSFNEDYLSSAYTYADELVLISISKILNLSLGLQSWLYGFFCSEPEVSSINIDLLHELSGSNYKSQNDFRKAVKVALTGLEHNNIIDWQHGITRHGLVFWKNKDLF